MTIPFFWLAGTILAVLAYSFSDFVRILYNLPCVLLGQWTLPAVWALVPVLSFRQIVKLVRAEKTSRALIWASLPVVATFIYFHGQIVGQMLLFQFNKSFY